MLNLKADEGTGMLNAKLGNVEGELRTIDPSTITVPALPPLDPKCKVHLSGNDFIRILKAAALGGDETHGAPADGQVKGAGQAAEEGREGAAEADVRRVAQDAPRGVEGAQGEAGEGEGRRRLNVDTV